MGTVIPLNLEESRTKRFIENIGKGSGPKFLPYMCIGDNKKPEGQKQETDNEAK